MSFPRKETDIPRRISTSQLRSAIRKVQSKRRQAIQNSNSETRRRNNQVRQNNASRKRAVDAYKREVRAYKTRVRANRARLESALKRRARQPVTVRYTVLHQSALSLANAYDRLDNTRADPFLSDLAEQETANSVALLNSLGDGIQADGAIVNSPIATEIELAHISPELDKRWHGAVYALSPENPDAARHFCVSAREILTRILSIEAPNTDVFYRYPDCETTEGGTPTRRSRIRYCLDRRSRSNHALESFVEGDIKDIMLLFDELNSGTHGPAGTFSLPQLTGIRTRARDAIRFMCEIAG